MAELRRAVIGSSAVAGAAGLGLALVFGVLLEPGRQGSGSCQTGLYPGTYADLLLPLHLLAFAALAGALLALARQLGHLHLTAIALAAAAGYAVACLAHPALFGPYAVASLALSIPTALGMSVALGLQIRAGRRDPTPELRWRRFARVSWMGQWLALGVLLPGAYAFAWLNGAGVFCF
jgi:hypothetical protein